MSFSNLFTRAYWLAQPAPALGGVEKFWYVGLVAAIGAGLLILYFKRKLTDRATRLFAARFGNCLTTMGIVGLLLFILRQERVAFFGWRLWFLPWLAVTIAWLVRVGIYWFKRVPVIRQEALTREERGEYLPKRK